MPHCWDVGAEQERAHDMVLHEAVPVVGPVVGPEHGVQEALDPQPFCGLGVSQVPEQLTWPAGHLHWPPWQVVPPMQVDAPQEAAPVPPPVAGGGHAAAQTPPAPQPFCVAGSSQVPEQLILPAGHLHWLFWHVIPPVQTVVQLPQYVALLVVSTQLEPQSVGCAPEQPVTQV
jgi:hypothetical protein